MLNKSENSAKDDNSVGVVPKETTKRISTDGTYMPVTKKVSKISSSSSSARTRPAVSRSRSRSKSGSRKSISKRTGAKVFTKKELEEEKNRLNKSVEILESVSRALEEAKTLHPLEDNDFNLFNSPANIKTSSIVIEQQHLPLLHQNARYELRQRSSPFVSKLQPNDTHLLRNSTPVQNENKVMKLKLDESYEEPEKIKLNDQVDSIGCNAKEQVEEEVNNKSLSIIASNACNKMIVSTVCVIEQWRKFIRVFSIILILLSFSFLLYFNKKSFNFVQTSAQQVLNGVDQAKEFVKSKVSRYWSSS